MNQSLASHEWRNESPVHDRVKELEQEVAELRRDAERYSFLKTLNNQWMLDYMKRSKPLGPTLDVAIDTAMKKATK